MPTGDDPPLAYVVMVKVPSSFQLVPLRATDCISDTPPSMVTEAVLLSPVMERELRGAVENEFDVYRPKAPLRMRLDPRMDTEVILAARALTITLLTLANPTNAMVPRVPVNELAPL